MLKRDDKEDAVKPRKFEEMFIGKFTADPAMELEKEMRTVWQIFQRSLQEKSAP